MKTKITTLLFGLVITPCVSLAGGVPSALNGLQQQLNAIQQQLNTLINAPVNTSVVCPAGAATRFVDNGDGTVCDHQTGLMWEQKNGADDGDAEDLTNPHDVDNNYIWTSTGTAPDGKAFTDFLARLNGDIASSNPSEQLGGYSDWRLPTSAELQTILDCSSGIPCIDPIFGPTAAFFYWSSTSNASFPAFAWLANFDNGDVGQSNKFDDRRVRAVRGGR